MRKIDHSTNEVISGSRFNGPLYNEVMTAETLQELQAIYSYVSPYAYGVDQRVILINGIDIAFLTGDAIIWNGSRFVLKKEALRKETPNIPNSKVYYHSTVSDETDVIENYKIGNNVVGSWFPKLCSSAILDLNTCDIIIDYDLMNKTYDDLVLTLEYDPTNTNYTGDVYITKVTGNGKVIICSLLNCLMTLGSEVDEINFSEPSDVDAVSYFYSHDMTSDLNSFGYRHICEIVFNYLESFYNNQIIDTTGGTAPAAARPFLFSRKLSEFRDSNNNKVRVDKDLKQLYFIDILYYIMPWFVKFFSPIDYNDSMSILWEDYDTEYDQEEYDEGEGPRTRLTRSSAYVREPIGVNNRLDTILSNKLSQGHGDYQLRLNISKSSSDTMTVYSELASKGSMNLSEFQDRLDDNIVEDYPLMKNDSEEQKVAILNVAIKPDLLKYREFEFIDTSIDSNHAPVLSNITMSYPVQANPSSRNDFRSSLVSDYVPSVGSAYAEVKSTRRDVITNRGNGIIDEIASPGSQDDGYYHRVQIYMMPSSTMLTNITNKFDFRRSEWETGWLIKMSHSAYRFDADCNIYLHPFFYEALSSNARPVTHAIQFNGYKFKDYANTERILLIGTTTFLLPSIARTTDYKTANGQSSDGNIRHSGTYSVSLAGVSSDNGKAINIATLVNEINTVKANDYIVYDIPLSEESTVLQLLSDERLANISTDINILSSLDQYRVAQSDVGDYLGTLKFDSDNYKATLSIVGDDIANYERITEFSAYPGAFICRMSITSDANHCHVCNLVDAAEIDYLVDNQPWLNFNVKYDFTERVDLSIKRGYTLNPNNIQDITHDLAGLNTSYQNNSNSNFSIVQNNVNYPVYLPFYAPHVIKRIHNRGNFLMYQYRPVVNYTEVSYINNTLRQHDNTELFPYTFVHTGNTNGAAMYLFNMRACYTSRFEPTELVLTCNRASDGIFSEESLPSKYKGNDIQVLKLISEHRRPWLTAVTMVRYGVSHANNYNNPTFNKYEMSFITSGGYLHNDNNSLIGGAVGSQPRTNQTNLMGTIQAIVGKATMDGKIAFSKFLTINTANNSSLDDSQSYVSSILSSINSDEYDEFVGTQHALSLIVDASRLNYTFDDNYDDNNNIKVVRQKLLNSIYRHFSEIDDIFDDVMGDASLSDTSLYQSKAMLDAQNIKLMRNMLSTYGAVKNLFSKITETKTSCFSLVDTVHTNLSSLFQRSVQSARELKKPGSGSSVARYRQFVDGVNYTAADTIGQLPSFQYLHNDILFNEIPSMDYNDVFIELRDKRYKFGTDTNGNASHLMISPEVLSKYSSLPDILEQYNNGLTELSTVDDYLNSIITDLNVNITGDELDQDPILINFTSPSTLTSEKKLSLLNNAGNNAINSLDDWKDLTNSTNSDLSEYIQSVKESNNKGSDTDLLSEPTLVTRSVWVLTSMIPAIRSRIDQTANPFDSIEVINSKQYTLSSIISWEKFKLIPDTAKIKLLSCFVDQSKMEELYELLHQAVINDDSAFIVNPNPQLDTNWSIDYSFVNITLDLSDYDYILNGCIDSTAERLNKMVNSSLDSCLSTGSALTDKVNSITDYAHGKIMGASDSESASLNEQVNIEIQKAVMLSNVNDVFSNILNSEVSSFTEESTDDMIIVDDLVACTSNDPNVTLLDKAIINDYCSTIKSAAMDYQSYVTNCKDATVTCLTSYYNTIIEDTVNELQDEVVINNEQNVADSESDSATTVDSNDGVITSLNDSVDSMVNEINDSIDQVVNANAATLEAYSDVTTAVKLNVKSYASSVKTVITNSGIGSKVSASMEQLITLLSHSKDSVKGFIGSCFSRIAHEFKVVTNHSFVSEDSINQYTGRTDLSPIYKALGMGASAASSAIGYTLAILNTVVNKAYVAMTNFVKSTVYDGQSVSYRLSGYETIDVPSFERELSFTAFEASYPFIFENVITPYLLYYNEGKFSLSYIYLGMFVFLTVNPDTETILIRLAPKLYENYLSDEERNDAVLYDKIVTCYQTNIDLLNTINQRIYAAMPNLFSAMKTLLHDQSLTYVDHNVGSAELEKYNIHIDFEDKNTIMERIAKAPYAVRNATCDSIMAWSSVGFAASTTILLTGNVYVGFIGMGISALAYGVSSLMNDAFSQQMDTGELLNYAFTDKTYGNAMITNGDIYQIIKSYPITAAESMLNQSNLLAARNLIHDGSGHLTPENRFIPIGFVKGEPKIGIHLRTDTEMSILRILKITTIAAASTAFVIAQFRLTKSARLNRKLDKTNAKMWALDNKDPKYQSKQTKLAKTARKTGSKLDSSSPIVQNVVNNVYSNGVDGQNSTVLDKVLDSAIITNMANDYLPIKQTNNDSQLLFNQQNSDIAIMDNIDELPDVIELDVQADLDSQTEDLTHKLNTQTTEIIAAEVATTTLVQVLSDGGIIDAAIAYVARTFNVTRDVAKGIIDRLLLHSENTL